MVDQLEKCRTVLKEINNEIYQKPDGWFESLFKRYEYSKSYLIERIDNLYKRLNAVKDNLEESFKYNLVDKTGYDKIRSSYFEIEYDLEDVKLKIENRKKGLFEILFDKSVSVFIEIGYIIKKYAPVFILKIERYTPSLIAKLPKYITKFISLKKVLRLPKI